MTQYLQRLLNFALTGCALWYALAFLFVASLSFHYPYSIEWLEGHIMETVVRAARGQPVYAAPSLEYVPFLYTPFYYYAAAQFTHFFGETFMAGRALSIASTVGVAGVLFAWAVALGSPRVAAFAAAGLYLAAYDIGGRWYDLARVDNLYLFLLLAGMFTLHTQRGVFSALIAAGLFAFAFYTKQTAVLAFAPLLLWTVGYHRRDGLIATLATLLMVMLLVFLTDHATGGWFHFYTLDVPAGHGLDEQYITGFFTGDLFGHWWPMLPGLLLLAFVCCRWDRQSLLLFLALALGLVGSSYFARIHWGGHVNVLLPMFAFFALVAACIMAVWRPLGLLVLLQFLLLHYAPGALIPGELLRENNAKAIQAVAAIDGDVFTPDLAFVAWPEGKRHYVYGMAAFDIFRSENPRVIAVKNRMSEELSDAFAAHRFAAVLPGTLLKLHEAEPYYKKTQRLPVTLRYPTGLVRKQEPQLLLEAP